MAATFALVALAGEAVAQDAPAAPVRVDVERPPAPAAAEAQPGLRVAGSAEAEIERARAAAKASETPGDDLERARATARAVEPKPIGPRMQGLEKSRDAARSADPGGGKDCMSASDARRAIIAKRAVALAEAVRSAKGAWDGDVIDYKLCTYDGSLAYELILLNGGGKVVRARIDASSGKLLSVR